MLATILGWFQAPTFPEDDDKTRSALLLNVTLNTILITMPVIFTGVALGDSDSRREVILTIMIFGWLIIFGARLIMLSGRVSTAGTLTVVTLFIGTSLAIYTRGSIRVPAITFYILAITIAGLAISRRAIIWTAIFSSIASTTLFMAERAGILPKPNLTTVNISNSITITAVFIVISILLYLAVKSKEEAFARLQQELAERVRAKEQEKKRREMMEKVIHIGKTVTEHKNDLRATLLKIRHSVCDGLDFDRVAIFLYNPSDQTMQGSFGTDRSGNLSEEWDLKFNITDGIAFFKTVLSQPDGYYFTQDYAGERNLHLRPGHVMGGVKYYAAVAVWAGDKPVAIICVDQLISGRVIKEEQLDALRFFAGYAGLAIENARLGEREQNRQRVMEKVIRIGKEVTEQTTNLRNTLLNIRDSVHDSLDFDRIAIFLYDPKDHSMQGSYGTDRFGEISEEWDMRFKPHQDGFLQKVLSEPNGFYHTEDYEGERNATPDPEDAMYGVKHYAAVACRSGDKPVAIICVDQLISGRVITDEQLEALRLFAGYAGLAIENTRLGEHEYKRRKMMEKVIQIGKTVTEQTRDLHTTLHKIRNSVRNDLDFDRAAVFLYDSDRHLMQGSYGTDRLGNLSEEWDLRFESFDSGFFQTVLNQPDGFYYTQDYENELNISSDPANPMKGVKHYAAIACWDGDKPVAVICVDQLISRRPISEEQQEALRLFAGYAGFAIENARLNTELESHIQEREKFIAELGNRNAELERFTYTVSHDLRSPIVTIKGFVGMMNKDIQDGQSEKVFNDMKRISNAADKMETLLSDLLELSRVGRIVNPPEQIDLVKLAYDSLETVHGRIQAKNITTRVAGDLPIIYGDRARIGEVLENLIDNAAKYIGNQPNPIIEIGTRNDNSGNVIYVKDNGIGIESQFIERVFSLFEKLDPTSEGTGIGLALIKRIIEIHGGKIWVESEGRGKGSMFCFTIPDNQSENKSLEH